MNIQSITSLNPFEFFHIDPIEKQNRKDIFKDTPQIFDKYLGGSIFTSVFFVTLPTPLRVAANIVSSLFFRGIDYYSNNKSFKDFINLDLITHVGIVVLLGEFEAKFFKMGVQASSQTPAMPPAQLKALQFKCSSFESKKRIIEAAYYDKTALDGLMLAMKHPEDFSMEHKSMIVHELRSVLKVFHPLRSSILESNLVSLEADKAIGNVYQRLYSFDYHSKIIDTLTLNYTSLYPIRFSPDFSEILNTLLSISL